MFVLAELVQSERGRVGDEEPEDAPTRRPRSDGLLLRLAQSNSQELLKTCPSSIEHSKGTVAGIDQCPGLFDQVT
jgi:hypothetical protein